MLYRANILAVRNKLMNTRLVNFFQLYRNYNLKRKNFFRGKKIILLLMLLPVMSFANVITWTGSVSTNWGINGNWSGAVAPTGTDDVIIPAGTINLPVINTNPGNPTGLYSIQSLTINAGATLTQTAGTLNVSADWTNNGIYSGIGGTVIFNGSTDQAFGGSQSGVFKNITINNTGGTVTLGANQTVLNGNLTITAGKLDLSTYTCNRSAAGGTITISNGATLQLGGSTGGWPGSNFPSNFTTKTLGASSNVDYNSADGITQTVYAIKYGNLLLSNRIGSGNSIKILSATLPSMAGDLTVNDYATFDMATFLANRAPAGGTMTVKANAVIQLGGSTGGRPGSNFPTNFTTTILNNLSTVEYNGASGVTQTVYDLVNYYNIIITNKTGSGVSVKKLTKNITSVSGDITINSYTTFDMSTFTANRTILGGTLAVMPNATLLLAGTKNGQTGSNFPLNFATISLDAVSTVEYNSASGAKQTVYAPVNYGNLTLSNKTGSGASIKILSADIAGIAGDLTVNGYAVFTLLGFNANSSTAGGNFIMMNNGWLRISGTTGGAGPNNNFPNNFATTNIDPGSTIEYYGANQDIYAYVNYGNLSLITAGTKTAPTSDLNIKGNFTITGTNFVNNGGRVFMNGTGNQSFAGAAYNILVLQNGGTKSTAGKLSIIDSLKLDNNTSLAISNNDSITLKSSATMTARFAELGSGATISYGANSKFVVERYVSSGRQWRFLSIPLNTSQTFKQAWQEGAAASAQNLKPGYGMQITDYGAGWAVNGFDAQTTGGATIKAYNNVTGGWNAISNTNATSISNTQGYMCYVRGDRTALANNNTLSATILRTSGTLYTGDQANVNVPANQLISIANPYASAVDMRNIAKSNVQDFFYVWDPKLSGSYGLGGYQLFSKSGPDYVVTPGGGSYGVSGAVVNTIESGLAFFVKGDAVIPGTLTFKENAKSSGSGIASLINNSTARVLRANLFTLTDNGSPVLADGIMASYADNYSNSIDDNDAIKLGNTGENVATRNAGKLLTVERRHTIEANDTIFLNLTGMRVRAYQWEINLRELRLSGEAWLQDNYLNTRTALHTDGATTIGFTVENIPGSYAANRFMIILKAAVKSFPNAGENNFLNRNNISPEKTTDIKTTGKGVTVYPNPVMNKTINLLFSNQAPGNYNIKLINKLGQVIYSEAISVTDSNMIKLLHLDKTVAAGNYHLSIIAPDGRVSAQQLMID